MKAGETWLIIKILKINFQVGIPCKWYVKRFGDTKCKSDILHLYIIHQ